MRYSRFPRWGPTAQILYSLLLAFLYFFLPGGASAACENAATSTCATAATSSPQKSNVGFWEITIGDTLSPEALAYTQAPVLYVDDFSSNPQWRTDDPDKFFWNSKKKALDITIDNEPPEHKPNRYLVTHVPLDSLQSFQVSADIYIEDADWYAATSFGLYSDDLLTDDVTRKRVTQYTPDSVFATQLLVSREGIDGHRFVVFTRPDTNRFSNENFSAGSSGAGYDYKTGRWYRRILRYDANNNRARTVLLERDTGNVVYAKTIRDIKKFSERMQQLGVSAHPIGEPGALFDATHTRKGFVHFLVDNVVVRGVDESAREAYKQTLPPSAFTSGDFAPVEVFIQDNLSTIYAEDFSSDPAWQLDERSDDIRWNPAEGAYDMHIENAKPDYEPSRFLVHEVPLDPNKSFQLVGDVYIDNIDRYGVIPFGIYSEDLLSQNTTWKHTKHYTSESTFNVQLSEIGNNLSGYRLALVGVDGDKQGGGGFGRREFKEGRWYTYILSYEAENGAVRTTVLDRETGEIFRNSTNNLEGDFSDKMRFVGVSAHPQGHPGTPLHNKYKFSSTLKLDNVVVRGSYAEGEVPRGSEPPSAVFFPGFQGSELYTVEGFGDDQVWPPLLDSSDIEKLEMDKLGNSENLVYTKDILNTVGAFGKEVDIYGLLAFSLENLRKEGDISKFTSFPYDWRQDVFNVAKFGAYMGDDTTRYPADVLEEIRRTHPGSEITLIGHSNGGLLIKALLDKLDEEEKGGLVDNVIFIGTPQTGAPKSVASLLHGYGQDIVVKGVYTVIAADDARYVSQNMPGAYSLLPSGRLLSTLSDPIVNFTDEGVVSAYFDAYGPTIDTEAELSDFLLARRGVRTEPEKDDLATPAVLNDTLLGRAKKNQKRFASWQPPDGVNVYSVVGVGLPTPVALTYTEDVFEDCVAFGLGCEEKAILDYAIAMGDGDGTVPTESASYSGDTYYVDMRAYNEATGSNARHASMSGITPITELIARLLANNTSLPEYVSRTRPTEDREEIRVSTHSPVTFYIEDEGGRRSGIVDENGEETLLEEIPNSHVVESPGSFYVYVPEGVSYEAHLTATGAGTFTLKTATLENDEVVAESTYSGIAISEDSTGELTLDGNGHPQSFTVDYEDDGIDDYDALQDAEILNESDSTSAGGGGGSRSDEEKGMVLGASTERVSQEAVLETLQILEILHARNVVDRRTYLEMRLTLLQYLLHLLLAQQ